jgi:mono/diheme cytochrome c family protein
LTLRRALLSALVIAAAVLSAGCGAVGRVTTGDPGHGKLLFVTPAKPGDPSCGSCHTLADAKTTGTVGPNLDDAFASDKEQGFSQSTIKDVVRGQIAYPEPPMPANLYDGQNADDIAIYVAQCSGNPNCGVTAAGQKPSGGAPPVATGGPAVNGKQVFETAGCSGCHTLKDAGATGTVGPDLDTLKPSKATVARQVETGGGAMPSFKGRLTDKQIQAVAGYVASVAGK